MTAENIAHLRQYARAVASDQTEGDEWSRLTLKQLRGAGGDPAALSLSELLRRFHAIWDNVAPSADQPPFTDAHLMGSFRTFLPPARHVLILADIFEFSPRETAAILDLPEAEVERLLAGERQSLADIRLSGRALIIEDAPIVALELKQLLESLGMEVCAVARNIAESEQALAAAGESGVDLVLSDYDLEGGDTGIEAVRLLRRHIDVPVIFITGYPEKVLTGEDVEPDFVIAKPYAPPALKAAVVHCLQYRKPLQPDA